jgi:hypothetical protein
VNCGYFDCHCRLLEPLVTEFSMLYSVHQVYNIWESTRKVSKKSEQLRVHVQIMMYQSRCPYLHKSGVPIMVSIAAVPLLSTVSIIVSILMSYLEYQGHNIWSANQVAVPKAVLPRVSIIVPISTKLGVPSLMWSK